MNIAYNFLNLPQSITGNQNLSYVYDATGRKLRKVSGNVTTDYVSGIQYTNGSMDFVQTEEGRAIKSGSNWNYEYTLTDHLGNNRLAFDTRNNTANKVQEDDYLPFGMKVAGSVVSSPENKYLYNKKEVQDELGQYDYGARFYDPVIARWGTVDPLAEKSRRFSPYTYGDDNSIRNIDPDGMETEEFNFDDGGGCCKTGLSTPAKVTGGAILGGSLAVGGSMLAGGIVTGPGEIIIAPAAAVVVLGGAITGGLVALWDHFHSGNTTQGVTPTDIKKEPIVQSGRNDNKLKPNTSADGDHSSFKVDKNGKISNTATFEKNPKNPNGFQEKKRVDVKGKSDGGIPTPHVHEDGKVRPAKKEDLPNQS